MRLLGIVLVTAALTLPFAYSAEPAQDDAGSGRDAPDTPLADVTIQAGVVHSGSLRDGDRHDWYAFAGQAGDVVEARASGAYGCWEIAMAEDDEAGARCADAPYGEVGVLRVTLDRTGTWYFHYQNVPVDEYRFSIGVNAAAPDPLGPALPSAETSADTQDDAGSGRDAPAAMADVIRIESGVPYEGTLTGLAGGDEDDFYAFEGHIGDVVQARAAGTVACYYIHTPSGREMEEFACTDGGNLLLDSSFTVTLTEEGIHYLHVGYFVPQDYAFAIGINEPAPLPVYPPLALESDARLDLAPPADLWLRAAEAGVPLPLRVRGEILHAEIAPNAELLAEGALPRNADGSPADLQAAAFLKGRLVGVEGSALRINLEGDTVWGFLIHPDMGVLDVAPRLDGTSMVLTPRDALDRSAPHAVGPVGGCLMAAPYHLANPLGLALGWNERTFDIAFAVDDDFVALHGAAWASRALGYANGLDGFYEQQVGLRIQVADLHAHDAAVFPHDTTSALLGDMASHYGAQHAGLARENAHLLSGETMVGAVGQANCIGGAGDPDTAYTVAESTSDEPLDFAGLGVRFFPQTALKISAHEIGHILSAHHHYAQCGTERATTYSPTEGALDVCTLMINDIGLASLQFSTVNKLTVRGYADAVDL